MKYLKWGIAAALCFSGFTATAQASSLDVTLLGGGSGSTARINYSGSRGASINNANVYVQELRYQVNAAPSSLSSLAGQTMTVFCTDMWETAKDGTFGINDLDYAPVSSGAANMGGDRASLIDSLYQTAGFDYSMQLGDGFTGADHNVTAGAFQLALWEILAEDSLDAAASDFATAGFNVEFGNFHVTADASKQPMFDLANAMLENAWNEWTLGDGTSLLAATGSGLQDFVVIVPLPAPVWMAAVGLLGVVALRRRLT